LFKLYIVCSKDHNKSFQNNKIKNVTPNITLKLGSTDTSVAATELEDGDMISAKKNSDYIINFYSTNLSAIKQHLEAINLDYSEMEAENKKYFDE